MRPEFEGEMRLPKWEGHAECELPGPSLLLALLEKFKILFLSCCVPVSTARTFNSGTLVRTVEKMRLQTGPRGREQCLLCTNCPLSSVQAVAACERY